MRAAWNNLLDQTFEDITEVITDKSRDFNALNKMREQYNALEDIVYTIGGSDIYAGIRKEAEHLHKKLKYSKEKADMAAWHNRRFQIIPYLTSLIKEREQEENDDWHYILCNLWDNIVFFEHLFVVMYCARAG